MEIKVIGIDLAKNNFHVCAVDAKENILFRKRLSRSAMAQFLAKTPRCLIAVEACGGAHHWARLALSCGHRIKMMSAQYVKPFVRSNKNDTHDAQAIAEAALRPSIPSVPVKDIWQQDILAMHRSRERLVKNKVELTNQIRGLLMEYGIVFAQGDKALQRAVGELLSPECDDLSSMMKQTLLNLREELTDNQSRLKDVTKRIESVAQNDERCQKVLKIPGVGPMTATAVVASIGNGRDFKNGRHLAAWLGLVPRHAGTGGKTKILGISKRGDSFLRKLLIQGSHTVVRWSKKKDSPEHQWIQKKYQFRHPNFAAVAFANKTARMIWKLLATKSEFTPQLAYASAA